MNVSSNEIVTRLKGPWRPAFLETRKLSLLVATCGYCNARCETCIWPYMENDQRVMSQDDFGRILTAFEGYRFEEFGLNIINEPFIDKHISEKIDMLVESGLPIEVIFFSSNWLIPTPPMINRFAEAVCAAQRAPQIGRIDINATISGIDANSYDRLQAGRDIKDAVAPYRPLDFDHAVSAISSLIRKLQDLGVLDSGKIIFRLKAYGDQFDHDALTGFWHERLKAEGIDEKVYRRCVDILLNHAFTTFARLRADKSTTRGTCRSKWLDTKLALGPGGEVGLCCEDGLRQVILGNLLEQDLEGLIASPAFQQHLSVNYGLRDAEAGSPCLRCQFYEPV